MSQRSGKNRKTPAYERKQGVKKAIDRNRKRRISFSFSKLTTSDGQTLEKWEEFKLLKPLAIRMQFVGQFSVQEAIQNGCVKQYTKVGFPPNSEFKEPKHISNVVWTVMHLTAKSKEVVAGFIDEDIFFIIFLDADHEFWPSKLKNT